MTLPPTRTLLICASLLAATACGEKEPPDDSGNAPVDVDGDGYAASLDCDDLDAAVHPGAPEGCDGVDDDCDGVIDDGIGDAWYPDADADGFGIAAGEVLACEQPSGFVDLAGDCDDADAEVHPGAAERCDGADDDCDGEVDEHPTTTWYADTDGDGWGSAAYAIHSCDPGASWVADATDCDDADESVFPGAPERCNGVDDDCDDEIDEDLATAWYADADGDGWGDPATSTDACDPGPGWVADATDCADSDAAIHPAAAEICDGVDNDCDVGVDDDDDDVTDPATWFLDGDGDGYGLDAAATTACEPPPGTTALGGDCDDAEAAYNPGAAETDCADPNDYNCDGSVGYADADGDGFAACEECADADAAIFPGAHEVCDGADDDCDGEVDEDDAIDAATWYADADGDNYGDAASTMTACAAPVGFTADGTDCDDADRTLNPGAPEVCDTVDNDCDGEVDDADASVTGQPTWYADLDGDGFGDVASATDACLQPSGQVAEATDCDDTAAAVHPAATEVCDGFDDDCDGATDEPDAAGAPTWHADADADGYGDAARSTVACAQPAGLVAAGSDCDDHDDDVNPGAAEVCNGVDDDCSGAVDEGYATDAGTWYADADGDGYGDPGAAAVACTAPSGHVGDATDCEDDDATVNPGAAEVCDGVDNDCDALADDRDPSTVGAVDWYADADRDGFGARAFYLAACTQPAGYVADGTDCDDLAAGTYPGAGEYCDGMDDDCDGTVDEAGALDGFTRYQDADGDGYGDAGSPGVACATTVGFVDLTGPSDTDCDDADPAVHPYAGDAWGDAVDGDCDGLDSEATWYDGESYLTLIPLGALTWAQARTACQGLGYDDLASVQDRAEMATLFAMSTGSGIDAGFRNGFLIGYTDGAAEGDFVWSDGLSGSWTHWAAGEPNDSGGEDCVRFNTGSGTWNDIPCSYAASTQAFACELRLSDVSVTDDDGDGLAEADGDCDDADATSFPGAVEWCDGIDNDCDGLTDEILTVDGGTATLTTGTYLFDTVSVLHGGTLYLEGEVVIEADTLTVDSTSAIDGDGAGEAGGAGTTDGAGSGGGGAGTGAGSGGGGYGGAGGRGGWDNRGDLPGAGGATYGDSASLSVQAGSGGGGMDSADGGAGGAALSVYATTLTLDGLVSVAGAAGASDSISYLASGGGSGGGLLLVADVLAVGGLLDASGGDGGSRPSALDSDGGGGGGGGRIKIFYGTSLGFTGAYDLSGGAGGCCGYADYGADGEDGTYYLAQQTYP